MNRIKVWSALALVGAFALVACGSDSDDEPAANTGLSTPGTDAGTSGPLTVTVSSADFPESQLLAEIYAQTLENASIRVARKDSIGAREAYYTAINNGEVSLIPEYTNSLLSYVLRLKDPNAKPDATTVEDQVTALKAALPANLTVGDPSTAEDKDVIVCSQAVAEQYSLKTLSDLAKVADKITIGAPAEFETRSPFGLVGFKDLYQATFKKFVPLKIDVMADSINSGAIDCGNMFSTMSAIITNNFIPLEDDKTIVSHEAVLPLLTTAAATPEVLAALSAVDAQLTTDVLKSLMVKIEVDKLSPDEVAKTFIESMAASTGS